jgi:hypothetical protein
MAFALSVLPIKGRSPESFEALEINFGLKDYFNRRIIIETGIKYKNKNEFYQNWLLNADSTVKITFRIKIDLKGLEIPPIP